MLIQEYSVRGPIPNSSAPSSSHGRQQAFVRCAICRNLTFHGEVSYVKTRNDNEDDDNMGDEELYKQLKGRLSTKMEAVVKTLIKIQTLDPNAKSLVFSTWNGVLDILGEALDENDIHYAALHAQQ